MIAENPEPPTFENTFVPLEDAGRHTDRVADAVLDPDEQPEHAGGPGGRQASGRRRSPPRTTRSRSTRSCSRASPRSTRRATTASLNAEQRRLVELHLRPLRARRREALAAQTRRRSARSTRSSRGCSPTSATRCWPTRTPGSCSRRPKDLAGLSDVARRGVQGGGRRAQARRQVGGRQHALERRSVPHRPRRAATCARRSGRRSRTAATTATRTTPTRSSRRSSSCAPSARSCSAIPTHAHWRMADTMANDPEKAQDADDARVAGGGRARARGSRRHAEARRSATASSVTIEPWDYLYYAEKVRKAKYDLDQDELKPYFELNNMIAALVLHGRAALRPRRSPRSPARCRSSIPDVRVWEVKDKATGALRRPVLRRLLRAHGQALGRVGLGLPRPRDLHRQDHHADHVEQQQLRQGRAGRAGADLARRRRDAVPRVRPRAARPALRGELSRPRRRRRATSSSTRRRCTRCGC